MRFAVVSAAVLFAAASASAGFFGDDNNSSASARAHSVNHNSASSFSSANQGQGQYQGANNSQGQVLVNDVDAVEADKLPGVPASVYVDACSSGASASFPGGGGSFGRGNSACLWLAAADAAVRQGRADLAADFLGNAEETLRRQTFVSRLFDWIPVVGWVF